MKQLALDCGLAVYQPNSLKTQEAQDEMRALQPDVLVVVAYGLILPQAVLDVPALGCLNVHASVLPRWRGAAPIQRAIEAGDTRTGITIMQMDAGLDTGDMLATANCPIDSESTAASLHDELARLGPPLLLDVLNDLETYQRNGKSQIDTEATYAEKILKSEAQIDWNRDAREIDRAIRAFNPFPICFSSLEDERVKIWQAEPVSGPTDPIRPGTILKADREGILVSCGSGQLRIRRLQLPGGKPLTAEQVLNARRELLSPGQVFAGSDASAH